MAQSDWSELCLQEDMGMSESCLDTDKVLEHKNAGGNVHLQPLLHFQPIIILTRHYGGRPVASLSGKTFQEDHFLAFIAADDMLHVLRAPCYEYLHIRSFEDGAVCIHPLVNDQLVRTRVQHGDLVAVTMPCKTPEIFGELHVFQGLPAEERFKRIMEFCFLADSSLFLAMVQSNVVAKADAVTVPLEEASRCG